MNKYITSDQERERIRQIYINKEKNTKELFNLRVIPDKVVYIIICDNDREITKEHVIKFIKKYSDEYITLFTVRPNIKQISPIVKVTDRVIELIDKLFELETMCVNPDFNEIYTSILENMGQFKDLEMNEKIIYFIV